jgi:hypothetical protein
MPRLTLAIYFPWKLSGVRPEFLVSYNMERRKVREQREKEVKTGIQFTPFDQPYQLADWCLWPLY